MSTTKFTGRYTESGKKVMVLETTQDDCNEMNKMTKELGLDKLPDYKESKPSKSEFLFGQISYYEK